MLTVVAAAVLQNGKIYVIPPPKRHGDIIHAMCKSLLERVTQDQQGFFLSDKTFATRQEAFRLARENGQLGESYKVLDKLFSEDLW